jgi:hypothetical protein
VCAQVAQIEIGINLPEQMILGYVIFQAKIVKQRVLIWWLLLHHRHRSLSSNRVELSHDAGIMKGFPTE